MEVLKKTRTLIRTDVTKSVDKVPELLSRSDSAEISDTISVLEDYRTRLQELNSKILSELLVVGNEDAISQDHSIGVRNMTKN